MALRKPSRRKSKKPTRKPYRKLSRRKSKKPTRKPSRKLSRRKSKKPTRKPSRKLSRRKSKKPARKQSRRKSRRKSKKPARKQSRRKSRRKSNRKPTNKCPTVPLLPVGANLIVRTISGETIHADDNPKFAYILPQNLIDERWVILDNSLVELGGNSYAITVTKGKYKVRDREELIELIKEWSLATAAVDPGDMDRMIQTYGHINNWDVSNVTDMAYLFPPLVKVYFDDPIGDWDVSNVTDMAGMFAGAESFNQPLNNWNVSNVRDMSSMFEGAESFNQPLNNWNVSNVESMSSMFEGAVSFNQPLNNWNVSNVEEMSNMFKGATSFNQDIGNWDVSKLTYMRYMFANATAFDQTLTWERLGIDAVEVGIWFHTGMFYNTAMAERNLEQKIPPIFIGHAGGDRDQINEVLEDLVQRPPRGKKKKRRRRVVADN